MDELSDLAQGAPQDCQVHTEIAYLEKHGKAGRLNYPCFRSLGLPFGSGATERNIRRVINLRLNGSGMFRREENAESMFQVRAQVITNRCDDRVKAVRKHLKHDGRLDRSWWPRPTAPKLEAHPPPTLNPLSSEFLLIQNAIKGSVRTPASFPVVKFPISNQQVGSNHQAAELKVEQQFRPRLIALQVTGRYCIQLDLLSFVPPTSTSNSRRLENVGKYGHSDASTS